MGVFRPEDEEESLRVKLILRRGGRQVARVQGQLLAGVALVVVERQRNLVDGAVVETVADAAERQGELSDTLDRLAEPHEIAESVLFLASPAADYITGHVLHVNGGMSM